MVTQSSLISMDHSESTSTPMPNFIDKKSRTIKLEIDEADAEAFHKGKRIGFVETTGLQEIDDHVPPLPARIMGWDVDEDLRGSGIAKAMVEHLVEHLGKLRPGEKNIGIGDRNALTEEGEAFTRRCQELGLIYPFEDENPIYPIGEEE